ncbi:hypothetical protein DSM3645_26854 [Blastopirellula marina DSM 3645]|uniref:Uncharacterized protein n=1 Tax=Blastopirellula marina DSM 3645 TaxID=314230 RepID=A3ZY96_9BACT|nr:hypothetical protein DSM3645_26854 [Blastopirellula marina DSM 3645]
MTNNRPSTSNAAATGLTTTGQDAACSIRKRLAI